MTTSYTTNVSISSAAAAGANRLSYDSGSTTTTNTGNLTVTGDLNVQGTQNIIHTDVSTTEQLLVTNDGTGPATAQTILLFMKQEMAVLRLPVVRTTGDVFSLLTLKRAVVATPVHCHTITLMISCI